MALSLITGGSGAGKTEYIYKKVIDWSMKEPQRQFFVIVPEQSTMQGQKDIVRLHPRRGTMNIDIVSFERLAYRIFGELSLPQPEILDDTGKTMVLRKLAGEQKDQLLLFSAHLNQTGFIDEIKSMLSEFYQYGVTPEALVESAFGHIRLLEKFDFTDICVSLKSSSVPVTMAAYRLMSEKSDYPLHLGVTETGTPRMGILKSAVGIGGLLALGIGDTMRVSLSADPVEEVYAARDILKAAGVRKDGPELVACPTCGRTRIDLIGLANEVEERLKSVDKPITVAVMGCAVNGPGEASAADVGIAGGVGEGLLFRKGEIVKKVPQEALVDELFALIEEL